MKLRTLLLTIALASLLASCSSAGTQTPVEQASEQAEPLVEQADPPKSEPPKAPSGEPAPTPRPAAPPPPAPLPLPPLAPTPSPPPSLPPDELRGSYDATATVKRVTDGDTLEISPRIDGIEDVRLIGVDTPETKDPRRGVQPYGEEASSFTASKLKGKEVALEFDTEKTDRYGRLLAYVYLGEEMFNETLLKEGFAQVATFPPNVKYTDRFLKAQREARKVGRGLWRLPEDQLCQQTDRGNGIGGGCGSDRVAATSKSSSPSPGAKPSRSGGGGDLDCADLSTRAEAQAILEQEPSDPHRLDGDKDGVPCKSLP